MPSPIPQTAPISALRRQQDKILKMTETAPQLSPILRTNAHSHSVSSSISPR